MLIYTMDVDEVAHPMVCRLSLIKVRKLSIRWFWTLKRSNALGGA